MPKQYELIAGQSMVMHTLNALLSVSRLEKIVVVVSPTDSHVWPVETIRPIKCGGATRAESVFNGLTQLLAEGEKILKAFNRVTGFWYTMQRVVSLPI